MVTPVIDHPKASVLHEFTQLGTAFEQSMFKLAHSGVEEHINRCEDCQAEVSAYERERLR